MAKRKHLDLEQKQIVHGQIDDLKLMLLPLEEEQIKLTYEINHNVEFLKLKYKQNVRKIVRLENNIKALKFELVNGREDLSDSNIQKNQKEVNTMADEPEKKEEKAEEEPKDSKEEDSDEDSD